MSKYLEWKKRAITMASGAWWLPPNANSEICAAAYLFKGAANEAEALSDRTQHGYTLDNDGMTFDAATGFTMGSGWYGHIGDLTNEDVVSQNILSMVIRVSNVSGYDVWLSRVNRAFGIVHNYYSLDDDVSDPWIAQFTDWYDEGSDAARTVLIGNKPTVSKSSYVVGVNRATKSNGTWTYEDSPYIDGSNTEEFTHKEEWNGGVNYGSHAYKVFGGQRGWGSENYRHGGCTFIAGAFYTARLTAEQHQAVATAMLAL